MFSRVKNPQEIRAMRQSGQILANVLHKLKNKVSVGMTTEELADIASKELNYLGGKPAFLGYQGFPDVLCTSVNEEVVHGIPSSSRILKDGDILSLDFGVNYEGMITDGAISFIVGKPLKAEHKKLVEDTEKALLLGIDSVKNGCRVGDIGEAVENQLNKGHYGIVRDLVGHGVGHHLHEDPNIPNYGHKGQGVLLKKNMTIAIEPMATLGDDRVYVGNDGWTVMTWDGSLAAHFEHTVLVNEDSAEIITTL